MWRLHQLAELMEAWRQEPTTRQEVLAVANVQHQNNLRAHVQEDCTR